MRIRRTRTLSVALSMWQGRKAAYVVQEPDQADTQKSEPVKLEHKQIWSLLPHCLSGEFLGLFETKSQQEEDERESNAKSQARSPDGAEMAIMSCGGNNICDHC